ncbi:MAG: nucleotidyltransferase domain-containing protein, partial [Halioglobus sp.]|nr:nucleotidyltransferase domain-containing protein [Halioglobus sp.]
MFDAAQLQSALNSGSTIKACKSAIAQATAYQHQQFRAGAQASELIRLRAAFIDTLLAILWHRQCFDDTRMALVAVGGYGRGELHPHSDIDLLILLGDHTEGSREALGGFLTLLWDIGLQVGHSVRDVDECVALAGKDISVLTNLMEARVICGCRALMQRVGELTAPDQMWPSSEFFQAKIEEQRERHAKFAETEYNLEPNVKGSPGGLRDLQVIAWIAERHFGLDSLESLTAGEFLTPDEIDILNNGRAFLWQVRYALHMITDREEDRLLFDHQRELASLWGLKDGDKLAVEQFMQVYYRWALALAQLNEVILQYFDQAILRQDLADDIRVINANFQIRNGYIEIRRENLFAEHPQALLEIFLLCANDASISGIAAPTIRQIRDNRHLIDDAFRADPLNHENFLALLASPHKMTLQLRRMARYGVLGDYLPEFGRIIGQMQHDLFHAYTVDAHTLEVIKFARHFMYQGNEEKFPVTSRVARRLRRAELLYIAALY